MAYSLVAHTNFAGSTFGGTSGSIDTTGANLIVIVVGAYDGGGAGMLATMTDNKGNTYTLRINRITGPTGFQFQLWECANPIVGTGHTFTQSEPGPSPNYNSFCIGAFSGAATSPFGGEVDATIPSGTSSQQAGSITPSQNGCLVISGLLFSDNMGPTATIDSGLTITDQLGHGSTNEGSGLAYLVQSTAGAINPAWAISNGSLESAAFNAYYLPAAGAAGTPDSYIVQFN